MVWFLISGILVFVAIGAHILSAVEIGADEHFEVTKAALWSKGEKLYTAIWNDQPPLHTVLLGLLFKCFGPSIIVARVLAFAFGILLLFGCFAFARERGDALGGWISVASLFVAPEVFRLSVSAMLEVPMMATALCSFYYCQSPRKQKLVLSSLMFAAAMQIKLTAAIFIPATLVAIVIPLETSRKFSLKQSAINAAIWCGTAATVYVVLGLLLGSGYREAWQSHFSQETKRAAEASGSAFAFKMFLDHPEGMLGVSLGLLVAAIRREWRQIALPTVLLGSAVAVHYAYRPYWNFYYLHFAVSIALLTGYAFSGLLKLASKNRGIADLVNAKRFSWVCYLAASMLVCVGASYGGVRFVEELSKIRNLPSLRDEPVIAKMETFAPNTKWVYTQDTIYAFHAGLLVVPELAVVPAKRFWSGQINDAQVAEIIRKYKPEQILLGQDVPESLNSFLRTNYLEVYDDFKHLLYVKRGLITRPFLAPKDETDLPMRTLD